MGYKHVDLLTVSKQISEEATYDMGFKRTHHPDGTTVTTIVHTPRRAKATRAGAGAGVGPSVGTAKPSMMTRLRARAHNTTARGPTTATRTGGLGTRTTAPRQQRKPGVGDKISGAMMKLKGEVERRPGEKAAGSRRMHGTDGRLKKRRHF